MRNKILLFVVALVVVTSLVVVGCSKPAPAPAPEPAPAPTPAPAPAPAPPKELTVGMSIALSGFAAEWGLYDVRAGELLINKINAAGGLDIGGDKYELKYIVYDDKYDPTEAKIIVNRLIFEDEVDLLYMLSGTPCTTGLDISNSVGMLQMGTDWVDDQPTPNYPLAFANLLKFQEIIAAGFQWAAKERPEIKTLAKISPNYPFALSAEAMTLYWAPRVGMEVVAIERPEAGTVDYTSILLPIIAENPDVIDLTGSPGDMCGLVVKQARAQGYTGAFWAWDGPNLTVIMEVAGEENTDGFMIGMGYGDPLNPAMAEVRDEYLEAYGPPFVTTTLAHYVAFEALFGGISLAGTMDDGDWANALRTGTFDTVAGPVWFGGREYYGIDNQIIMPLYIADANNGEIRHLGALTDFAYPLEHPEY